MKIIDLLNKIANGEEPPKKIGYRDRTYHLNVGKNNYFDDVHCSFIDFQSLHDEIEIIEEKPKKIEECKNYECFEGIDDYIEHLRSKINELQKAVNYLLEKENK